MEPDSKPSAAGNLKTEPQNAAEAQASGIHLPAHGHNASSQQNVSSNPDLVLNYSHEHQHEHLHHHKRSFQGRDDEVVYSHGHDVEKSNVPDQNAQDSHHQAHHAEGKTASKSGIIHGDAEKGAISPASLSQEEDDPRSHKVSGFYGKWKILFHAAFLMLMTG
jgi:concentrative nucleoside transporter, CNT family